MSFVSDNDLNRIDLKGKLLSIHTVLGYCVVAVNDYEYIDMYSPFPCNTNSAKQLTTWTLCQAVNLVNNKADMVFAYSQ